MTVVSEMDAVGLLVWESRVREKAMEKEREKMAAGVGGLLLFLV
jgi:hypothetical protein